MRCTWATVAILLLAWAPRPARAGPEKPRERPCSVSGRVTQGGVGVSATVQVRLRLPMDPYFRGAYYRSTRVTAMLAAFEGLGDPVQEVATDEDGVFLAQGLVPGHYDVRCEAAGGGWCSAQVSVTVAGEHAEVELPLITEALDASGLVLLRRGEPYVGRLVAVQGHAFDPVRRTKLTYEQWTTSDAEGRFTFRRLGRRPTTLAILVGATRLAFRGVGVPQDEIPEFTLEEPGAGFEGEVLDVESRAPVAGAHVLWEEWFGAPPTYGAGFGVTQTGEDGRFTIPGASWTRKPRQVFVQAPGYGALRIEHPPEDKPFQVLLRKEARVVGVVVDEAGAPVPGIAVALERRAFRRMREHGDGIFHETWHSEPVLPTVTDGAGRFEFAGLCWGEARLVATGGGRIPRELVPVDRWQKPGNAFDPLLYPLVPGETTEARLVVKPGHRIRGRVLDAAGKPVVGVPVSIDEAEGDPRFDWEGIEIPPSDASAEDGSFLLHGLLPEVGYELRLEPSGYAPVKTKAIRPSLDDARALEVRAGGPWSVPSGPGASGDRAEAAAGAVPNLWVDLQVVDEGTGEPLAEAQVTVMLTPSPGCSERFGSWFHTDAQGRSRLGPFGAVPGDVGVERKGYVTQIQVPFPVPTADGAPMLMRMRRAASMRGRVLLPDGSVAGEGAFVHARNVHFSSTVFNDGSVRVEADGTFEFEEVSEGEHEMEAHLEAETMTYESPKVTVSAPADGIVLRLEVVPGSAEAIRARRERVRIRVLDAKERPVDAATVLVQKPGETSGGIWADLFGRRMRAGLVELDKDPSATDVLVVRDARAADGYASAAATFRREPLGQTTGELTVRLAEGRVLSGRVLDAGGAPIGQVAIEAVRVSDIAEGEPRSGTVVARVLTFPDGRFRLVGLGEEEVEIRPHLPLRFLAPWPPLRVTPGADEVGNCLEIRSRPSSEVRLKVVDAQGAAVPGVVVRVGVLERVMDWSGESQELGWFVEGTTDDAGEVRLLGLDPTREYAVETQVRKGVTYVRLHEEHWKPLEGTFVLK